MLERMTLDAAVALVTGGSRGIGRAVARELAGRGARVVVNYAANEAAARETLAALAGDGHSARRADVADPVQARDLVATTVDRYGRIDVLVNSAGVFERHPILETDHDAWQDVWRRTLDTNLVGPANLIHAVAPHMVAAGGGRIVNVSSRGAFRGEPTHPAYGASKAGLNSLTQSLAKALAPHNVIVTAVAPGYVDTDMAAPYLHGPQGDAIRADYPIGRITRPRRWPAWSRSWPSRARSRSPARSSTSTARRT